MPHLEAYVFLCFTEWANEANTVAHARFFALNFAATLLTDALTVNLIVFL